VPGALGPGIHPTHFAVTDSSALLRRFYSRRYTRSINSLEESQAMFYSGCRRPAHTGQSAAPCDGEDGGRVGG